MEIEPGDMIWFVMVLLVHFGMGGGQMTTEFVHEEISIMECNGLS